jgi:tetratricopeptide (TPR) repeat protein
MKTSKLVTLFVVLVAALAAVGWIFRGNIEQKYTSQNTPFSVLVNTNTYFADAQTAANAGDYQKAQSLYQKALGQAQDSTQRGQIEYKLALLDDSFGNTLKAVDEYKAIIANPNYDNYRLIKAYAAQAMAELYYRKYDSAVTEEIFKDPPYASMVVKGHIELTYRHLDEYATSYYPLGLAELRIANWYAAYLNSASTPDGSATSTYPAIIQQAIKLADADIERTKNDPNASKLIPQTMVRKETLYISMYGAHLVSAQETEQACKDAVDSYSVAGYANQDGFARYYYAVFLSRQGVSRGTDMKTILAPIYADPGYKRSLIPQFFKDEEKNLHGQKRQVVRLANGIPEFKTYLLSLGWKQSDF